MSAKKTAKKAVKRIAKKTTAKKVEDVPENLRIADLPLKERREMFVEDYEELCKRYNAKIIPTFDQIGIDNDGNPMYGLSVSIKYFNMKRS